MSEKQGKMNIDFEEVYDQESDIYYVSFKTGEPSCAVEIDDALIIEEGIFTGFPTGFRILNFKKNPVKSVGIFIKKFKDTIKETESDIRNRLRTRTDQVRESLERVTA